jgi:hypothetical protein
MARKLKTYITSSGFFDLALAAPSMKAALELWGMGSNAFHHGFATQTDDPKIVAVTMAKPGIVLKRPVGTKGDFKENAALPKRLWKKTGSLKSEIKPHSKPPPKPKKSHSRNEKTERAAIVSFEQAKTRRDSDRKKEQARQAEKDEKQRAQRDRAADKAEAVLERALERHDLTMAAIEKDREKLDRRAESENTRWESEREELNAALRRAKD